MNLAVAVAVFPVIFLGELPDKTMFASLVLATKGRPLSVWLGAALAFAVHVVIAVTVGVVVFRILPHRVVDGVVAAMFLAGAVWAWRARDEVPESAETTSSRGAVGTAATAAGVIFVAEWGDLTQVLTANLAARYHDALSVGAGALAALAVVAALAVISGHGVLRRLPLRAVRKSTAVVLVILAIFAGVSAI